MSADNSWNYFLMCGMIFLMNHRFQLSFKKLRKSEEKKLIIQIDLAKECYIGGGHSLTLQIFGNEK